MTASYRYSRTGQWNPARARRATGPATDAAFLNSPAVLAALAKIDRVFGPRVAAMSAANQTRRNVMLTAWGFRRSEPARPFADCLRGAWKMIKGMAKEAARFMARARHGGRMDFSPSLIRSPIQRSLTGQRYAAFRDNQAAITTARVGG